MPYFSIIIPLYNRENFIYDAVDSVLKQQFSDFELIIVDDGSCDNSFNIVSEIVDTRIKIIRQENSGVSSARNKGVKSATGQYLAFLDSDDYWYPDHLFEAYKFFSTNTQTKWYSSLPLVLPHNTVIPSQQNKSKFIVRNFLCDGYMFVNTITVVFDREYFDKSTCFPEDIKHWEDFLAFSKFALIFPLIGINNRHTAIYFRHENSVSSKPLEKFPVIFEKVICRLEKIFPKREFHCNFFVRYFYVGYLKIMIFEKGSLWGIRYISNNKDRIGLATAINWLLFACFYYICEQIIEILCADMILQNKFFHENFIAIFNTLNFFQRCSFIQKNRKSIGLVLSFIGLVIILSYGVRGVIDRCIEHINQRLCYLFPINIRIYKSVFI